MTDSLGQYRALLTMAGGILCSVGLAIDDIAPDYVGVAVIIPVLLGFGVLEIYGRYRNHYGATGRAGVALTGVGLGFLLIAILLFAVIPSGLLVVVLVAVPGITGLVTLTLGSIFLALTLYRLDVLSVPTAVLLGLGIPLTPLLGALLAALVGASPVLSATAPSGVVPGLSGSAYGIGWALTGYRLWQTAEKTHDMPADYQPVTIPMSPQLVSAGVVGGAFVLLSVGRFLPLGPLSGTPWVNQSLVLDVLHLVTGVLGLGVTAWRDTHIARRYNQAAGILSITIAVLTVVGVFQDVRVLYWLTATALDLNVPDLLLHLPAGSILLVVGFLIGESATAERSPSSPASK